MTYREVFVEIGRDIYRIIDCSFNPWKYYE